MEYPRYREIKPIRRGDRMWKRYQRINTTPHDPATITDEGAERFRARAPKGDPAECWMWPGGDPETYGRISIKGRIWLVHRVAYFLAYGTLTPGLVVDHTCRNRKCVNPSHLREVSYQSNAQNRSGTGASGVRGVHAFGDRWRVFAKHNGVQRYGGTFDTLAEARDAAISLRAELFGERTPSDDRT